MNSTNMNSTTSHDFTFEEFPCHGKVLMTCCSVVIFITGITGNSIVLSYFRSQRNVRRLTVDKLFLLNICYNNLVACCISLPIHYMDFVLFAKEILPRTVANCLCLFRLIALFSCLGVGNFLLAAICFDRYETLVKYNQNRFLTRNRAFKVTVVFWITAYVMMLLAMTGYGLGIIKGRSMCTAYMEPQFERTKNRIFSSVAIIVVVTVWLTPSNTLISLSLIAVSRQIKQHIATVRNTLGTRQALQEIKVVRAAVYFVVAYTILWTPFGVARGIKKSISTPFVNCFFAVSYTLSYFTFAVIPFLYIMTHNRIKSYIFNRNWSCFRKATVAEQRES